MAAKVAGLPEVGGFRTLSSFIPTDQDAKVPVIRIAAAKLAEAFDEKEAQPTPSDAENIDALNEGAARLKEAAGNGDSAGAFAMRRLSAAMTNLADASPEIRAKAADTLLSPLNVDLEDLRQSLEAQPVTQDNLPRGIVDDWIAPGGKARLSILPKADPEDNAGMRSFARAVLAAEPSATEGPIAMLEAGDMIQRAFIEAGLCAFASIAVLLVLFLRRISDVVLTLFPLALAGLVTMELMALFGISFNFANIIALPLAARRRGRVQDLLHCRLARRHHPPSADPAHARGRLQRAHDGDGLRQPVVLEPPRHFEHGQTSGSLPGLHARRRGPFSANPHGKTEEPCAWRITAIGEKDVNPRSRRPPRGCFHRPRGDRVGAKRHSGGAGRLPS